MWQTSQVLSLCVNFKTEEHNWGRWFTNFKSACGHHLPHAERYTGNAWPSAGCHSRPVLPAHLKLTARLGYWKPLVQSPTQTIPKVLGRWPLVNEYRDTPCPIRSLHIPAMCSGHYLVRRSDDEVQQRTCQLVSGFHLCQVARNEMWIGLLNRKLWSMGLSKTNHSINKYIKNLSKWHYMLFSEIYHYVCVYIFFRVCSMPQVCDLAQTFLKMQNDFSWGWMTRLNLKK